jgi:pyridoxal phosphate enzyme (YggS family)
VALMSAEYPSSANGWTDSALAERARLIRERITQAAHRANRAPENITLVAVSKTVALERLLAAAALGLTIFGENRVQEAQEKRAQLATLAAQDARVASLTHVIRWDLIGHLQTNKAARALELFDRVQSVDSLRVAEALSARKVAPGHALPILLEVNVGGETSKSGFAPDEVEGAARAIAGLPALRLSGLMTVAPVFTRPEDARDIFRRLRELRDYLREAVPAGEDAWGDLSMGMSDDFEVAIEEGATLVRIGRGLFGARSALSPH